jgi:hypothetical protein
MIGANAKSSDANDNQTAGAVKMVVGSDGFEHGKHRT